MHLQCTWRSGPTSSAPGARSACPGSRRRSAAFDGTVVIRHRSYALAPDAPEDFDASQYTRSQHGITEAQRQEALAAVTAAAAAEGLDYHLDRVQPTNSRSAHRLLHHAATHNRRNALSERLTQAYFAEGRHLGRLDELVELAFDAGLDPDQAQQALVEDRHADAVDADCAAAAALGITGVPFTMIDGRWGIPGAQPPNPGGSADVPSRLPLLA